ncbi:MAG: hypothetical protein M3Y89_17215 [Actinomycetota bacterium]|nr:hypothetical protein [Actinomycetota bacterium]
MALPAEVEKVLASVRDRWPGALIGAQDSAPARLSPLKIHLRATGEDAAQFIHEKLGTTVSLRVGMLAYPPDAAAAPSDWIDGLPSFAESVSVASESRLTVRAGQATQSNLILTNLTTSPIRLITNGVLDTVVLDPGTGQAVGSDYGPRRSKRLVLTLAPAESRGIPAVVGAASRTPRLGYRLPTGNWAVVAVLHMDGVGKGRSGAIPIYVE